MVKDLPRVIATLLREEPDLITLHPIKVDLVTQFEEINPQSRQILQKELDKETDKIISTLGKSIAQNPHRNYQPQIKQLSDHLPQMIQDLQFREQVEELDLID